MEWGSTETIRTCGDGRDQAVLPHNPEVAGSCPRYKRSKGGVLDEHVHAQAGVRVRRDGRADRFWERLFRRQGGEHVDVLGRPLEQAVGLDGVAAGEGEPVAGESGEADLREALVEGVHRWVQVRPRRTGR